MTSFAGDNWQTISADDFALAGRVTVFVGADLGGLAIGQCQWPLMNMTAFVDAVTLDVLP